MQMIRLQDITNVANVVGSLRWVCLAYVTGAECHLTDVIALLENPHQPSTGLQTACISVYSFVRESCMGLLGQASTNY